MSPRVHMKTPDRAKILERTVEEGDCLLWTGPYSTSGVPVVFVDGKRLSVRRVLLELSGRTVAPHYVLGTKCDEPRCVCEVHVAMRTRQDHLRHMTKVAITQPTSTVARTMARRARSKIDRQIAEAIRAEPGTLQNIAKAYEVSTQTVHRIKTGKSWVSGYFGGLMR